MVVYRT